MLGDKANPRGRGREAQVLQRMRRAIGIENPLRVDVWLESEAGAVGPEKSSDCEPGRRGLEGAVRASHGEGMSQKESALDRSD